MENSGKIEGFEKAKKEVKENVVTEWALTDEDLELIRTKLEIEQRLIMDLGHLQLQLADTTRRAEMIKKERQQTCMDLEEKLKMPKGINWIVDFDKKCLRKR